MVSVPVAYVQELAAACRDEASKIPLRYMRPEAEADPVACSKDGFDLPVVDLSRLLHPQLCHEESVKLDHACENWGFFQLINHGVSEELISNIKADISEFFKLPLEQKQVYAIGAGGDPQGYGQHFVVSEEQKLDWADLMYIVTQPPVSRNMAFWPAHPPKFRDSLDKYSLAIKEVASGLLGWMGRNLGLDPEFFLSKFMDQQSVRMNYYPPCLEADKVLGLSPHTDAGLLTLLLQVSDHNIQGLQIRKACKWFPIEVLPDAIIVNVGDALEIMSNGKYRSVEHRAVVNTEKERLSIATFHFPAGACMVSPLPEVVKGENEKYKSMTMDDYLKNYFAAKLDGRSFLESLKLE